MDDSKDFNQAELIARLADGFAALLEQVEELRYHSQQVEKLLGYERKVLMFLPSSRMRLQHRLA